ncbi:MAG TPA: hypothetical protein VKS24_18625, partial [Bradyrhizobium sp.]|nr:hypothetical protein [Bradyrhizobium sp.]
LIITPSTSEFEGTVNVSVSAVAQDGSAAPATGTTSTTLTVNPVSDVPVVTASTSAADEGSTSTLTLGLTNAAELFANGDDSVTITVTLDNGATLTQSGVVGGAVVTPLGDGEFQLTVTSASQLTGLTITPPSEFEGTVNVSVLAVAQDGSAAPATGTTSTTLTMTPVAEPASLAGTVTAVSGDEGGAIDLTIVATPFDSDDNLSINISGVPAGATLSAGTLNSDGSYTLTAAELSGLQLLATDAESGGVLQVVVTSSEGTSSTTSSTEIFVAISSELTITGTVHINGDILDDSLVTVTPTGTLIGVGTVTDGGNLATIVDDGAIVASSSHVLMDLHANITGDGLLELTNNTVMEIGGSVGPLGLITSTPTVEFNISQGSSAELILDDPAGFSAPVTGFRGPDIIDLKGLAYSIPTSTVLDSTHTSAIVGSETISLSMTAIQTIITVTEGSTTATIDLLGDYTGHSFTFSSDGSGGTQFVDPLAIYSGTTLELPGASADSVLFVNNAGISGTLLLDNATAFSGQISGFTGNGSTSDAIDLKGLAFDSATAWTYTPNSAGTGGALTISEGTTVVDTVNFAGNYTTANFEVQSDGNGGILITDPPTAGSAVGPVIMQDPGPAASSTIVATAPNQTLTGFASNDTFAFNFATVGQTTITDFHPDSDALQFKSPIFASALAALNAAQDDGHGNTVIAIDAHDSITLNGVLKAQLHATDFHVV